MWVRDGVEFFDFEVFIFHWERIKTAVAIITIWMLWRGLKFIFGSYRGVD
jgi:hypothetical protein